MQHKKEPDDEKNFICKPTKQIKTISADRVLYNWMLCHSVFCIVYGIVFALFYIEWWTSLTPFEPKENYMKNTQKREICSKNRMKENVNIIFSKCISVAAITKFEIETSME